MADTRTHDMPKAYDPSQVEAALYQSWLAGGYFRPRADPAREPFCIIMPPPNVTGELHLGHALTATVEDTLIRWHRMLGDPTLWLPGVDHAGIATQNVVEKQLAKEGLSRHDLGREQFLERVWQWVRKYRSVISHQHARLGASCDWDREVFTMDDGPQKAVRATFVRLYNEGLIYRGERIINWCPRCMTALSDLEVEHEEQQARLWYVRYPLLDDAGNVTDDYVVIATTRPETIVADVAIAVNPNVKRWQSAVGRRALLPIIERHIPIIADDQVDPKFGTGALKITPGHDAVDFEIGGRHGLPAIVAIGPDGAMNEHAGPYQGLDRFETRTAIAADLEALGLIEKTVDHTYAIGHCERCATIVEPLVSKQWFVNMKPLAEPAIAAVKDGRIEIIPRRFSRVYMHWMESIRDWCISRQLWWGHRIPVWYCENGHECAAVEDPAACPQCRSQAIEQDPDVLDTWFSSGLWPHSTLGWPEDSPDLRYFYPTSVLETGYDILFFWVARMIMMGLYNMNDVPFRHVYLHGLIRDARGRKMTKSVGNVVDPLLLVDRYGCDALRFTLATGGTPGNDFRLFDEKLEGGRNFANKVWNASRFVVQSIGDEKVALPDAVSIDRLDQRRGWPLEDRWIVSRALATAREANRLLGAFQINEAGRLLYDFFWSDYCDWYLEMAKVRLKEGDRSPLPVLAYVLQSSLRLLHPIMPFVTEEVWQHLRTVVDGLEPEFLIAAAYPLGEGEADAAAESSAGLLIDIVRAIRNIRAERGVEPARYVEAYIAADGPRPVIEAARPLLEALARVRPLHIVGDTAEAPSQGVASAVLAQAHVVLPLAGMIDLGAERQRLTAQLQEAEGEVKRLEAKLANEQFRARAPAAVVAKEEEKLAAAGSRLEGLRQRLAEMG
ncbi:MAG: valine--tRNA ligase [Dehalococcoidia bacterium]|nr:valine--tRNA ligase [Dehalococcoidia bacterium]